MDTLSLFKLDNPLLVALLKCNHSIFLTPQSNYSSFDGLSRHHLAHKLELWGQSCSLSFKSLQKIQRTVIVRSKIVTTSSSSDDRLSLVGSPSKLLRRNLKIFNFFFSLFRFPLFLLGDFLYSGVHLGSRVRGICFYAVTAMAAILLFVAMMLMHPFVMILDWHKRRVHHMIAKIWATLIIYPFYRFEFEGLDNLPSGDAPAVYVSNHQSFLDTYTLLTLGRSFKFISKASIFVIPVIGWAMFLMAYSSSAYGQKEPAGMS